MTAQSRPDRSDNFRNPWTRIFRSRLSLIMSLAILTSRSHVYTTVLRWQLYYRIERRIKFEFDYRFVDIRASVRYFRPTGTTDKKITTALSARFRCGRDAGVPSWEFLACWFVRYLTWRKVGWKTAKAIDVARINEDYFTMARIAIEISFCLCIYFRVDDAYEFL